jgi:hypothetical protein
MTTTLEHPGTTRSPDGLAPAVDSPAWTSWAVAPRGGEAAGISGITAPSPELAVHPSRDGSGREPGGYELWETGGGTLTENHPCRRGCCPVDNRECPRRLPPARPLSRAGMSRVRTPIWQPRSIRVCGWISGRARGCRDRLHLSQRTRQGWVVFYCPPAVSLGPGEGRVSRPLFSSSGQGFACLPSIIGDKRVAKVTKGRRGVERGKDRLSFADVQCDHWKVESVGSYELASQCRVDKSCDLQHLSVLNRDATQQHRSHLGNVVPQGCGEQTPREHLAVSTALGSSSCEPVARAADVLLQESASRGGADGRPQCLASARWLSPTTSPARQTVFRPRGSMVKPSKPRGQAHVTLIVRGAGRCTSLESPASSSPSPPVPSSRVAVARCAPRLSPPWSCVSRRRRRAGLPHGEPRDGCAVRAGSRSREPSGCAPRRDQSTAVGAAGRSTSRAATT